METIVRLHFIACVHGQINTYLVKMRPTTYSQYDWT